MGEYAQDSIDKGMTSGEGWYIPVNFVESKYVRSSDKLNKITKGENYLLRNFKMSMNILVECVTLTEKSILFKFVDEAYPKVLNITFWIAKSNIHVLKSDLVKFPNSSTYYIPNWVNIMDAEKFKKIKN